MKSFLKVTYLFLFAILLAFACESSYDALVDERIENNPLPEPPSGEAGSADFSNYVAIGSSLTAGFMDAALYNEGQENSMPALLAQQLEFAGAPDEFNQPDINSELGYNTSVEQPQGGPVLGRFKLDTSIPGPSPTVGGELIGPYTGETGNLNNFGVPGIVVGQLITPATGGPSQQNPAFNPFYQRFASNPSQDGMTGSTILGDAIATQPTFFTLWIGANDVLGYAVSGASNPTLLTSEGDFNTNFNTVIDQLMDNTSADGVVGTIPSVTLVPFFRAITYNAIELNAEEAQQLSQALQPVNDALQAVADNFPQHSQEDMDARKINYSEGANPILVNDPELDDLEEEFDALGLPPEQRQALVPYEQSRPLTSGELVTLSAGAVLGTEYNPQSSTPTTIGVVIPLGYDSQASAFGDAYYLTLPEQAEIQDRINTFNTIIATTVAQNGDRLALFDINAGLPGNPNTNLGAFADLYGVDGQLGIRIEGTTLRPDFSPNGVFSTDGIHSNQRGNAILANEIIRVIEEAFGSSIPEVDVLNLPSVQLCAGECVSEQEQQKAQIGTIRFEIATR
jgi:lysophospholipase L1-like esterase